MNVEKKIEELGIELPEMSPPGAMYIPVKQLGNALASASSICSLPSAITSATLTR